MPLQTAYPEIEALRERVDEHEQVVEGVFANTRLMAEQVSRLSFQVQSLSEEVRLIRNDMPAVLTQCAIAIVGNPEVWAAARKAMAMQARDTAGGWLLGLLTKPLAWIAVALVLFQVGGPAAVWAWIKSHAGG